MPIDSLQLLDERIIAESLIEARSVTISRLVFNDPNVTERRPFIMRPPHLAFEMWDQIRAQHDPHSPVPRNNRKRNLPGIIF